MTRAPYRNHQHYLDEGWAPKPKEMFEALARVLEAERPMPPSGPLLDVGCATGELIAFLGARYPGLHCTGVDVAADLVSEARRLLPGATFREASALALPAELAGMFDCVVAMGVMSIFDETQIGEFWRQLVGAARTGGTVVVCAPLNEYGVDTMIRHRKRRDGTAGPWETGWNIFARETIAEILAELGCAPRFEPFRLSLRLAPREDPVRTWTLATERNPQQLTNGLKLLVDHYFIIVRTPAAALEDQP
jgi:SAM-dependent methyltransferase